MKQFVSNKFYTALHIICIILIGLVLVSQSVISQTQFKKYSGNPILTKGAAGSWDGSSVFSGPIIYHNSKYHMWYGGLNGAVVAVGYAYSDDGFTWTKYSGNPVLSPGVYGDFDANIGGCWVTFYGGTFHMWYSGKNGATRSIGYAYSSDGISWTKHPTAIFQAGAAGNWDAGGVAIGPVIREDTVFKMFYWGKSATSSWMTGMATSSDSIHWTRQNSGNPVMAGGKQGEWDQYSQAVGTVLQTGDLYEMWYDCEKQAPYGIGYASSTNKGLNWTTFSGNPILPGTPGSWDEGWNVYPTVLRDNFGRYLMYYSGTKSTEQSIGLAIDSIGPLTAGTYTIGSGGFFPTIDSAFARLSRTGIVGSVTLSLIDTLYVASPEKQGSFTLKGPIAGTSAANRITIRPADNVAVTIKGNGLATLRFTNVSYLTLDGMNLTGSTRLKVHSFYDNTFTSNNPIFLEGNSDFNIVQHLTAGSDNVVLSNGIILTNIGSAVPDHCTISENVITSGVTGILICGESGGGKMKAQGNIVRANQIGSTTDSLIAWGIEDAYSEGTVIENNHVENLRLFSQNTQLGINTFSGKNTVIRNNSVHNLSHPGDGIVYGIIGSGGTGWRGSNVWIYNNKVWDLKLTTSGGGILTGIEGWYQDSMKIEYNSVILSESNDGIPANGSHAARFTSNNVYPVLRNNILVNTRDDSPAASTAIYMTASTNISDYNDLVVGTSSSAYIAYTGANYKTLANWQATGKDPNSISKEAKFVGVNLHIDTTDGTMHSLVHRGIPIPGITYDFEGYSRKADIPDIGADEFFRTPDAVSNSEIKLPETFGLMQNYPNPFNPTTTIRYALPTSSLVKVTIHDLLGREIAMVVNEEQSAGWKEVQWNASSVSSGMYFYKLVAGNFTETKKLLFVK